MKFGKSRTQQHFKPEQDINAIVARAQKTGFLAPAGNPLYADVSNLPDFQSAKNQIIRANDQFMTLNPRIRERFDNDPARMIAWLKDPANQREAIRMGLMKEKQSADDQKPDVKQNAGKKGSSKKSTSAGEAGEDREAES